MGPVQISRLLERHGTPREALATVERLKPGDITLCSPSTVERELAALDAFGWHLLFKGDPAYPPQLAAIADAPWAITVRGDPACLHGALVGIVGARNASTGGRRQAREMAASLADGGFVVVSGLARGIDEAAHEGALSTGKTVAVIATGPDVAYPEEHGALMERISEQGAVVSERPLGAAPTANQFPKRNRIISGLGIGLVVVEAAQRSGTLITARFAADQGRELMAVPGSPLDPRHRGTNQLLREGAHLVETASDALAVLEPLRQRGFESPTIPAMKIPPRLSENDQTPAKKPRSMKQPMEKVPLNRRVRERLGVEPLLVDELIRECHASAAEVQNALFELELSGELERHPGNRVSLARP